MPFEEVGVERLSMVVWRGRRGEFGGFFYCGGLGGWGDAVGEGWRTDALDGGVFGVELPAGGHGGQAFLRVVCGG